MNPTLPATRERKAADASVRPTTMRAVVKASAGPGAEVREVPVPTCGPGELLLRVRRAGVCGTDLHIVEWDRWSQGRLKPPVTLGHEFVGDVVEVGAGVKTYQRGDRVACESHIVCQSCLACRTGNAHVCENTRILGVDVNGGFAEFVAVPAANAWRAPANVPIEVAACMEPLGNAVHTAFSGALSGRLARSLLIARARSSSSARGTPGRRDDAASGSWKSTFASSSGMCWPASRSRSRTPVMYLRAVARRWSADSRVSCSASRTQRARTPNASW